jgi:carbonic anhydrase
LEGHEKVNSVYFLAATGNRQAPLEISSDGDVCTLEPTIAKWHDKLFHQIDQVVTHTGHVFTHLFFSFVGIA